LLHAPVLGRQWEPAHWLQQSKVLDVTTARRCLPLSPLPKQVEAFTNKTGKFAIQGYPQKLGFLLHGPPGEHSQASALAAPLGTLWAVRGLLEALLLD